MATSGLTSKEKYHLGTGGVLTLKKGIVIHLK